MFLIDILFFEVGSVGTEADGCPLSTRESLLFELRVAKLQKVPRKSPRQDLKSVCRGESLNKCSGVL